MKENLILNTKREGYGTDQCGTTLTVGELIELLQDYDEDMKVYLGNDYRGSYWYTYGSITEDDFYLEAEDNEEEDDDEF